MSSIWGSAAYVQPKKSWWSFFLDFLKLRVVPSLSIDLTNSSSALTLHTHVRRESFVVPFSCSVPQGHGWSSELLVCIVPAGGAPARLLSPCCFIKHSLISCCFCKPVKLESLMYLLQSPQIFFELFEIQRRNLYSLKCINLKWIYSSQCIFYK